MDGAQRAVLSFKLYSLASLGALRPDLSRSDLDSWDLTACVSRVCERWVGSVGRRVGAVARMGPSE